MEIVKSRGEQLMNEYYHKLKFKDYLYEEQQEYDISLIEALDSSYEIERVEVDGSVKYYYLSINTNKYRIIVDTVGEFAQVAFTVFRSKWVTKGVTNKLSAREVLKLFGTIYSIIKGLKSKHLLIQSDEPRKIDLYKRMVKKLQSELFTNSEIYVTHGNVLIHNINYDPEPLQAN